MWNPEPPTAPHRRPPRGEDRTTQRPASPRPEAVRTLREDVSADLSRDPRYEEEEAALPRHRSRGPRGSRGPGDSRR